MNKVELEVYKNETDAFLSTIIRKIYTDYDGRYCVRYKYKWYRLHSYPYRIYLNEDFKYRRRYKKSFKGSETGKVVELWLHKSQPEAYVSSDCTQIYFDDFESIYSYGSHFELGHRIERPGKSPIIIVNNNNYSKHTNNQIHQLLSRIPNHWTTIQYDAYEYGMVGYGTNKDFGCQYSQIAAHLAEEIEEEKERLKRKLRMYSFNSSMRTIKELKENAFLFIETFRCKSVVDERDIQTIYGNIFNSSSEYMHFARKAIRGSQRKERKHRRHRKAIMLQKKRLGAVDVNDYDYNIPYAVDAYKGVYLTKSGRLLMKGEEYKLPSKFIKYHWKDNEFFDKYKKMSGGLVKQACLCLFDTDDVEAALTLSRLQQAS